MKLAVLPNPENKPLRVIGELVGGCGMTVEFSLVWDDLLPGDSQTAIGPATIVIDRETEEYIGSATLTIDYRDQQGFRLITPHQILAYALQVKERWP
jgi:Fe-S cluster assembly iron-binding protein IscA